MIPVHGSVVGERQPAPIVDCVHRGWASSAGLHLGETEQSLVEHRGVKQRAAPSSGMAALP